MASLYDINGNPLIIDGDDESSEALEDLLPDRLLIWHDEFNKAEIDLTKWNNIGSVDYAENIEYIANSNQGLQYRSIKDYRKGNNNRPWSSAYLNTDNLFEFKYGRLEAKIKFTSESIHHSTFWTLGANFERLSNGDGVAYDETKGVRFPSCGEIDIAEFHNGSVGCRTHWSGDGLDATTNYSTGGNLASITLTPSDWHIYACEWTEQSIDFYVDNVRKTGFTLSGATVSGYNPFTHPHFIILNCVPATAGAPTWDIAETQVAWVRVYAPVGVTEKVVESAISIPETASISVGERLWLGTPTFTPANPSDMTVNWLSHNDDIVTCHGGMLIGVSAGTTYVQAISKHGYTSFCKVTVS